MFTIHKRMEISAAHKLDLPYESKCQNLHGHGYIIDVWLRCPDGHLTGYGMVTDFTVIKKAIHDRLDHNYLNEVMEGLNPTAENMCWWIRDELNKVIDNGECFKVRVQETEGNDAQWEKD